MPPRKGRFSGLFAAAGVCHGCGVEPLKIDLGWLANALEDHSNTWYLDLRSGEVILDNPDADFDDETGGMEMNEHPEIFLHIDPLPSHEGYALMEEYTDGLPEGRAKSALTRALSQLKPFRRFKDALFDLPEERESWFKFYHARLGAAAIEFLKVNSVPWTKKDQGDSGPA